MKLMSVVLPIYNVAEYLPATLDSLARQTHRDLEVVMVDDGSTDESAEIAAKFAAHDSRFRLFQQDNHGLGHARNAGLPHVSGDYLTFVDSDDIVPHFAFQVSIATLESTGSDFLSGNEYRFDSRGAHQAPMLEADFAVTRLRTNVTKRPSLMRDLLPHNKVYRKDFWDSCGLAFPEGILFEDGPVSVKAHALAKSVDVISTPIYYWRLREGADRSLSQLKNDRSFFVDRIFASKITVDFLEEHRPDLLVPFYAWDLRHKFTLMYKALPAAPKDVQEAFVSSAIQHLDRMPKVVFDGLPPRLQRRVRRTQAGDLKALLRVLRKARPATATPGPKETEPEGVAAAESAPPTAISSTEPAPPTETASTEANGTNVSAETPEPGDRVGTIAPVAEGEPVGESQPTLAKRPKPRRKRLLTRAKARTRTLLGRSRAVRVVRALKKVSPAATTVTSAVMDVRRVGDSIALNGFAYINGLPADGPVTARNRVLWIRHEGTRRLAILRRWVSPAPQASASTSSTQWTYGQSGYRARLPLKSLKDRQGNWLYGKWVFAIGSVTTRGLARSGLRHGTEAYRADAAPIWLDKQTMLIPIVVNGVFGFRLERAPVILVDGHVDGATLVLSGVAPSGNGASVLTLGRVAGVPELRVNVEPVAGDADGTFRSEIDLHELVSAVAPAAPVGVSEYPDRFWLTLSENGKGVGEDVEPDRVACATSFPSISARVDGHRILVGAAVDGRVVITVRLDGPTIESVAWSDGGAVRISGTGADSLRDVKLVGWSSDNREQRILPCVIAEDGSWTSVIDPENVPQTGGSWALRAGMWRIVLSGVDPQGRAFNSDLPYVPGVFSGLPNFRVPYLDRYWVKRLGLDGVALRINSRLRDEDRGGFNQRVLREVYYPSTRTKARLRETALYISFTGKQYSDSPRAVYEELLARGHDIEHVWVTRDGQAPVPPGTRTVEANSREYFEALATSRYIVSNTHLPSWFRRRDGQVVAQTWHGIGFKRVAFDMDTVKFANPGYLKKLEEEAPNWSFLVSPSAFCTEILRRAFRYEGEICEIGSPRNDLLVAGDRETYASRVRESLGIAAHRKILLYAPTWRDNQFYGPGRYKFQMMLDTAQFPERLRQEYALLVRRHPNTVDDLRGYDGDFLFDVANYPDVRELLAATDVLITDYSTIGLDFLNTGRPVLFYTYDLAEYRDNLRGFYFDLEADGPGPVLETTTDVVAALEDLDGVQASYKERYAQFREVYCHYEDGNATSRLIDRLIRDTV